MCLDDTLKHTTNTYLMYFIVCSAIRRTKQIFPFHCFSPALPEAKLICQRDTRTHAHRHVTTSLIHIQSYSHALSLSLSGSRVFCCSFCALDLISVSFFKIKDSLTAGITVYLPTIRETLKLFSLSRYFAQDMDRFLRFRRKKCNFPNAKWSSAAHSQCAECEAENTAKNWSKIKSTDSSRKSKIMFQRQS